MGTEVAALPPCSGALQLHEYQDRQQPPREGDDVDPPLYCTDEFRIYYMKVLPCSKRYCHDWTTCPFAHPGEKARRRDPRVSAYTGIACPDMKKDGVCVRGELCPYAHNVFEYWLHPTRYRTQLCNDGTNCKRRVCFFAHTLPELRVPSSKPFVNPQALAAAAAAASARRAAAAAAEQQQSDLSRLRSGHSVGDAAGASDLARRLTSLQLGQQLAAAQQSQQAQQAQSASDQNALLVQLLSKMLQQKEQNTQQQSSGATAQLPPGLQEQMPSSEALAALYQQLSGAPPHQQQLLHDPAAFGQGQAALLAALDASNPFAMQQQFLGDAGKGGQQHPTPRSSLDVTGFGLSEYSTPRASFELSTTGRTPRSSFDMHSYTTQRSSFDSQRTSGPRSSLDSCSGASAATAGRPPSGGYLQDVNEEQPESHGGLSAGAAPFQSGNAPMAFGPGGAYFLTGASASAATAMRVLGSGASAANQRSASLPACMPTGGFGGNGNVGPLHFRAPSPDHRDDTFFAAAGAPRHASFDFLAASAANIVGYGEAPLPPRAPGSARYSLDSRLPQGSAADNAFQHHLMGALPGSFNYFATVSDSAANHGLPTEYSSGGGGGGGGFGERHQSLPPYHPASGGPSGNAGNEAPASLFANSGAAATGLSSRPGSASDGGNGGGINHGRSSSLNLGSLYLPSGAACSSGGAGSRPPSGAGSGSGSPRRSIWSPQT